MVATQNIIPGAGPPPLPGVPYNFRGFNSDEGDQLTPWTATLVIAGRAVARISRTSIDQPIQMVFASDPEQRRFEAFAAARALRSGLTDEEEMQSVLLALANASYEYRRITKLASRATVFQVKGQADYYYLNAKPTPEVQAQLRTAFGPRLDRILTPARSRSAPK